MMFQLYKAPRNRYVLDIEMVDGQLFQFLDLCASLLGELLI